MVLALSKLHVNTFRMSEQRINTMRQLQEVVKLARTEGTDLPLTTIAVCIAEGLGDTHEVEIIIRELEQYIS